MKNALVLISILFLPLVLSAQVPPTFPSNVLGQRQVNWNYTGLRPISAAPPVGVHPRIFIGLDDRADVCNRLTNTAAGLELFTNYIQRYTTLLRNPRSAYDSLPNAINLMPDGTPRLGNVGFYNDPYFYYTNLVSGQTNNISMLITNGAGSVYARTMAGEMALEALENWVYQNVATNQVRATQTARQYSISSAPRANITSSSRRTMRCTPTCVYHRAAPGPSSDTTPMVKMMAGLSSSRVALTSATAFKSSRAASM